MISFLLRPRFIIYSLGLLGLIAGLYFVRQNGYIACTAKYEQKIATQKEQARKEIVRIEGSYNAKIKQLYKIKTDNRIAGKRTTYAIDSLYNNSDK